SWWSHPLVTAADFRFLPDIFDLRGSVPVGYALFALAVGVTAGAVIRRTIPAMAATIAVYVAVRTVVEIWLRPHFARPRMLSYPLSFDRSPRFGLGDWVLSTRTVDGAGRVLDGGGGPPLLGSLVPRCPGMASKSEPAPDVVLDCYQRLGLHVESSYHPGDRYWQFQAIETALFV